MSASHGAWQRVGRSGVLATHAALLHTGQVLFFTRPEDPSHKHGDLDNGLPGDASHSPDARDVALSAMIDLSGPNAYKPVAIQVEHNPFCSGHTFLPDGRLLVVGGDKKHTPAFSLAPEATTGDGRFSIRTVLPAGGSPPRWTHAGELAQSRWYPTCTLLADGTAFIVSGTLDDQEVFNNQTPTCEHYPPNRRGPQYLPLLAEAWPYDLYPFVFLLPNGSLFVFAKDRAYFLSHDADRWIAKKGPKLPAQADNGAEEPAKQYPNNGSAVLLPLLPSKNYAAEILIVGGGGRNVFPHFRDVPGEKLQTFEVPATDRCFRLKIDADDPALSWQRVESMPAPRVMPDAVLLPDGTVLVVNGVSRGFAGGYAATGPALVRDLHEPAKEYAVRSAAIYHPDKNRWEELAAADRPRLYHSTALLLPDARVLVAGSDHQTNEREVVPPNSVIEHKARAYEYQLEVFSPPYLFEGPRPVIRLRDGDDSVRYGQAFRVEIENLSEMRDEDLTAALLAPGAVTHGNNMTQRHVGLKIDGARRSATTLCCEAPPNSRIAPPGYYMLFVLHRGVPSEAVFLQLLPAQEPVAETARAAAARSAGGAPPGMACWFRADFGITTDENGGVVRWVDWSGGGNDLESTLNTHRFALQNRPRQLKDELNGRPVLRFPMTANWLGGAPTLWGACLQSRAPTFLPEHSPRAVFVVAHAWPGGGNSGIAGLLGWGDFVFRIIPSPKIHEDSSLPAYPAGASLSTLCGKTYDGWNDVRPPDPPPISYLRPYLLECASDGNSVHMAVNGSPVMEPRQIAGMRLWSGPLVVGRDMTGGDDFCFFRGDIAEILIYDRVLDENERLAIEEYLKNRYALW